LDWIKSAGDAEFVAGEEKFLEFLSYPLFNVGTGNYCYYTSRDPGSQVLPDVLPGHLPEVGLVKSVEGATTDDGNLY